MTGWDRFWSITWAFFFFLQTFVVCVPKSAIWNVCFKCCRSNVFLYFFLVQFNEHFKSLVLHYFTTFRALWKIYGGVAKLVYYTALMRYMNYSNLEIVTHAFWKIGFQILMAHMASASLRIGSSLLKKYRDGLKLEYLLLTFLYIITWLAIWARNLH